MREILEFITPKKTEKFHMRNRKEKEIEEEVSYH